MTNTLDIDDLYRKCINERKIVKLLFSPKRVSNCYEAITPKKPSFCLSLDGGSFVKFDSEDGSNFEEFMPSMLHLTNDASTHLETLFDWDDTKGFINAKNVKEVLFAKNSDGFLIRDNGFIHIFCHVDRNTYSDVRNCFLNNKAKKLQFVMNLEVKSAEEIGSYFYIINPQVAYFGGADDAFFGTSLGIGFLEHIFPPELEH
ncbi:MAG: hypothetical protein EBQ96_07635 [Proteobacteria bacterium]|nr:hypothetical protein [Pseudomonadota bacterium]